MRPKACLKNQNIISQMPHLYSIYSGCVSASERETVCAHICIHPMYIFISEEYDWVALCQMWQPFINAIASNSGCHTGAPTPCSLYVCSCDLGGGLIDCRGNVWDGGGQAWIRKPPSPHMCHCSVCEGFALIFLIKHSFTWDMGLFWLLCPFIYLSVMNQPRARPPCNGM